MPASLAAPMCNASLPRLDDVRAFARVFDVSLSVAAQRWAEISPAPCAFVESRHGVIKRAVRSRAFRGVAVQRRALEEGTLALEMSRGGAATGTRTPAHESAWGSAAASCEIHEECVSLGDTGAVLTWLWHR